MGRTSVTSGMKWRSKFRSEQAASAVSIASTRMKDQTMLIRRGAPDITRSYGPDFGDVRNEMAQQIQIGAGRQRRIDSEHAHEGSNNADPARCAGYYPIIWAGLR